MKSPDLSGIPYDKRFTAVQPPMGQVIPIYPYFYPSWSETITSQTTTPAQPDVGSRSIPSTETMAPMGAGRSAFYRYIIPIQPLGDFGFESKDFLCISRESDWMVRGRTVVSEGYRYSASLCSPRWQGRMLGFWNAAGFCDVQQIEVVEIW